MSCGHPSDYVSVAALARSASVGAVDLALVAHKSTGLALLVTTPPPALEAATEAPHGRVPGEVPFG